MRRLRLAGVQADIERKDAVSNIVGVPRPEPVTVRPSGRTMQDMKVHLESLRADAAECAPIRDFATDPQKRALFTRLADHLASLASDVEAAIAARLTGNDDAI
jgi:hypothetical protein